MLFLFRQPLDHHLCDGLCGLLYAHTKAGPVVEVYHHESAVRPHDAVAAIDQQTAYVGSMVSTGFELSLVKGVAGRSAIDFLQSEFTKMISQCGIVLVEKIGVGYTVKFYEVAFCVLAHHGFGDVALREIQQRLL